MLFFLFFGIIVERKSYTQNFVSNYKETNRDFQKYLRNLHIRLFLYHIYIYIVYCTSSPTIKTQINLWWSPATLLAISWKLHHHLSLHWILLPPKMLQSGFSLQIKFFIYLIHYCHIYVQLFSLLFFLFLLYFSRTLFNLELYYHHSRQLMSNISFRS